MQTWPTLRNTLISCNAALLRYCASAHRHRQELPRPLLPLRPTRSPKLCPNAKDRKNDAYATEETGEDEGEEERAGDAHRGTPDRAGQYQRMRQIMGFCERHKPFPHYPRMSAGRLQQVQIEWAQEARAPFYSD